MIPCNFGDRVKVFVEEDQVTLWSSRRPDDFVILDLDEWRDFLADVKRGFYGA